MKKKLTFISKLIVALLILPGGYVSAEQQDAEGLLIKARRALASTARILQQLETDTRKKSNVPFLAALRKMEPAMNEMQKGLDEKSSAYFSGLGTATVAAKEAAVTLVHSGLRDPRLIDSVKTLGHAVEVSRKFFGKEALRSKKGSALTDEEKLSFAKVQSSAASLLERLNELKSKHPADKELASQIDLLVASASRLNPKELTLQSYVEALLAADELEGLWSALSLYINNQYKPDWVHLSDTVEALVKAHQEIIQGFLVSDWTFAKTMIVIPEHYDIEVDLDDSELEKSEGYLGSLQVNMESGDEAIGDFEDVDSEDSDPDEKDQDENDVAEFEELEDPDDELTEDDAEMHLDENQSDISPDGEEEASAPAQG